MLWPVVAADAAMVRCRPTCRIVSWRADGCCRHRRWLITGVADWRTGLPYSLVDAALDFVGPRNQQRMPNYLSFDLGLEHRVQDRQAAAVDRHARAYNAFNAFLPADVQANISSPAFGSLYNSQFRQYRLQVRFER